MDVSKYKLVIFDEVFLLPLHHLTYLRSIMKQHEGVIFLATGDENQLDPVQEQVSLDPCRRYEYLTHCSMFPHVLKLRVNKRVHAADRAVMAHLTSFILDEHNSIGDIKAEIRRLCAGRIITDLEELRSRNICKGFSYLNDSRELLNNAIHGYFRHSQEKAANAHRLSNGTTYHTNGLLICKDAPSSLDHKAYRNFTYRIVGMSKTHFTLEEIEDEGKSRFQVPVHLVQTHFALPYCNTVHSSQGSDVDEDFFIADWTFKHADRRWLYTAITRLRSFQHLHILDVDLLALCKANKDLQMMSAATSMLRGYKDQDRVLVAKGKVARPQEEEYPSPHEIVAQFNAKPNCGGCGTAMSLFGRGPNKATLQRESNSLGHTRANTATMLCLACNARKN
jgi:hypothetical protein